MIWKKLEGEPLKRDIMVEIEDALKAEKGNNVKVCIGSD